MTIKRCPYCRSIINEADRYCNSCGTQLLFPEDENIEEPIPGGRPIETEEEAPGRDDLILKSIKTKPEPEKSPDRRAVKEPDRRFLTRELPEMGRVEPPAPPTPKSATSETNPPAEEPPAGDFESGFPTSNKEMEEIARLLATLEKKEKIAPDLAPPSPAEPSSPEREAAAPRQEEERPSPPPTGEELPLWAERVKEGETPGFKPPTQDSMSRDLGDFSFELPSEPASARPADRGEERTLPPADEHFDRRGEEGGRPFDDFEFRLSRTKSKRGPLAGLKARIYDLLFITLVWVAAVWASAQLLRVPLFDLALNSLLEVGIFYVILLVGYFALFLSFLGETLGDRMGSSAR
jgi:hypothetical protein